MSTLNYETDVTRRNGSPTDTPINPAPITAAELAVYVTRYLTQNPGCTRPAMVQYQMVNKIVTRPVVDMACRLAYDCIPAVMVQMHSEGRLKRQRAIAPKGVTQWEPWEYHL